jgi:hypothetical protein
VGPDELLNPALKSWFDDVIVPILVRDFVAARKGKNGFASAPEIGIDSLRIGKPVSKDGT